jgi:DNA segregation ATPase FtsK/SpoIIIE-like protein
VPAYTFDLPPEAFYDSESDDHARVHQEQLSLDDRHPKYLTSAEPASKAITLRMPVHLLARLDRLAERESVSRSHVMRRITSFVLDAIGASPTSIEDDYTAHAIRLFDHAAHLIGRKQEVSLALLQRHLRIDLSLAMALMDELEKHQIVTPPNEEGRRFPMVHDVMADAKQNGAQIPTS